MRRYLTSIEDLKFANQLRKLLDQRDFTKEATKALKQTEIEKFKLICSSAEAVTKDGQDFLLISDDVPWRLVESLKAHGFQIYQLVEENKIKISW